MPGGESKDRGQREGRAGTRRRRGRNSSQVANRPSVSALLDEIFPDPGTTGTPAEPNLHRRADGLSENGVADARIRWLERKSALGERTAEVSHEVRNALVSFKTFLRLLPEQMNDPEFMGPYRESVSQELRRLERLLEAVLHHAQPGWQGEPADQQTEAGPALEAVAQLLRRTADLAGIKLQCATQEGAVSMARDSLQQVILNLALNALEATPTGGRVCLSNQRVPGPGAGFMEIQLDDDGEGVAQEDRERIFAAFQSARGDRPGGLGLSICRELVEAAGGEIRLSSSANGGARLIIQLPACDTP
ncbi:MAG: HAMP domain-containing sensor histidine kinase [Myxococcota bacterium]|nr:HAMP domain-containing sensor histidine kinase [Myxococcota bacterium]